MKTTELKPGFHVFGNKGALWSNKAHIAKSGFSGCTLCGTPMLSHNHCQEVTEIGCEKCLELYNKLQGMQQLWKGKTKHWDEIVEAVANQGIPSMVFENDHEIYVDKNQYTNAYGILMELNTILNAGW